MIYSAVEVVVILGFVGFGFWWQFLRKRVKFRWIHHQQVSKNLITCSSCWWLEILVLVKVVSYWASLLTTLKSFRPLLVSVTRICAKECLKLHFVNSLIVLLLSCVGVDFKVKYVDVGGKKLKLAIWDTGNNKCMPHILFDDVKLRRICAISLYCASSLC